jgi:hypothetical protein
MKIVFLINFTILTNSHNPKQVESAHTDHKSRVLLLSFLNVVPLY